MDIQNIVSIYRIKINRKKITASFNPVSLVLLIVKFFEILPKQNE